MFSHTGLQKSTAVTERRGHNGHYHPGYTFIPASVETYGYLGKPLVRYLNTLSGVAAARRPALTNGSFLAGAHRDWGTAPRRCRGRLWVPVLRTVCVLV